MIGAVVNRIIHKTPPNPDPVFGVCEYAAVFSIILYNYSFSLDWENYFLEVEIGSQFGKMNVNFVNVV